MRETQTLDVREVAPKVRHPLILSAFDALGSGTSSSGGSTSRPVPTSGACALRTRKDRHDARPAPTGDGASRWIGSPDDAASADGVRLPD